MSEEGELYEVVRSFEMVSPKDSSISMLSQVEATIGDRDGDHPSSSSTTTQCVVCFDTSGEHHALVHRNDNAHRHSRY